jgi:hypothetical protein
MIIGSLLEQPFYARREALSKGLNLCYTAQEAIQHSHLLPLLQEGRTVIAILFGDETPVTLHLQRDPEVGEASLIAGIQTNLPADEAVNRLLEFSDVWLGNG